MRTLDETWKLCKSMWRWIAEHIDEFDGEIEAAKDRWLGKHGFIHESEPADTCFFCDYCEAHEGCDLSCPGKLVDSDFSCTNSAYHFRREAKLFYNKIRRLDYKRQKGQTQ